MSSRKDKDTFLQDEEHFFHSEDRKVSKKEKKRIQEKDRSKYKKTDQDQKRKNLIPSSEEEGIRGRILAIYPEGICVKSQGEEFRCQLKGSLKKEKNKLKNLVAVGDFVRFQEKGKKEGVILSVEPRYSILSRADNLHRHKEQLIAVNIDQVIITASIHFPPLKPFLIDRYIIAAQKGNMAPVIVINKIDLLDLKNGSSEQEIVAACETAYAALGIPLIKVSTVTKEGIEELKQIMQDKSSVFSGQSGVGKSSLINAVTGLELKTREGVQKTLKGSHTTTTTQLIPLEHGGFCVDTPGIKSFGLWDLDVREIKHYFPEIATRSALCKFPDCSHQVEQDCAVKQAVEAHEISPVRFASYCALMETLAQRHQNR